MINFKKLWSATPILNFLVEGENSKPTVEDTTKALTNFTKGWSDNGVLNFTPIEDTGDTGTDTPRLPLGIHALSPYPKVQGLVSQTYPFSIHAQAVQPKIDAEYTQIVSLGIVGTNITKPTVSGDFVNDINVDRGVRNITRTQALSGNKLRMSISSKFEDSPSLKRAITVKNKECSSVENNVIATSQDMDKAPSKVFFDLVNGDYISTDVSTVNEPFDDVNDHIDFFIVTGDRVSNRASTYFIYPPRSDCKKSSKWMEAERIKREWDDNFENGIDYRYERKSSFEDGVQPVGYRPQIIKPVEPIKEISPELNFLSLWDHSGELDFLRIELDALIIMNEISIYYVADDGTKTAIHPVSASIELDIDSQVWSFKGQLFGADSLTWLTYRANFEININGHQLLFVLREYSRASSFASDAYTFTAVTNTQWLFSPYANLYSGAIENETGVWQIVEGILAQENFTLNRTLTPEWVLQADSFSYLNKTPIEIAIQAAQASGAILQPNKAGNRLDVQPRYKTSPWNWNALADEQCDHVINADYVITESSSDNTTTEINRVLISGETHGVITDVVKSGTAGDVRGSDVVSNLSQDHNVNMELARNMMGDSGDQEILGLSLPLLAPDSDFGLLLPGEIVRIVYTDKSITGLCLSNSIPIQSITDVSQSVKLELNNGYR